MLNRKHITTARRWVQSVDSGIVRKLAGLALVTCAAAVMAAPVPGGTHIRNAATATYVPAGYTQTETVSSNTVEAVVTAVEALTLTQDQSVQRPANVQVTLNHVLTNTGNVASGYTLTLGNSASGCSTAPTLNLSALKVVRDTNNNGVVDAGEPAVPLNAPNALTLQPGESALLMVQGNLPVSPSGAACLSLVASTAAQAQTATNHDTVLVADVAEISLTKSAYTNGLVVPGTSRIDFTINGSNIGSRDAMPTGQVAGLPVTVDGVARSLVLVRDMVPAGTQYIPASLQSGAAGAVRLFRLPGDANFAYRSDAVGGSDVASAVEVAIGLPVALAKNASVQMKFAVTVRADAASEIRNAAFSHYDNGTAVTDSVQSNIVLIPLNPTRIGVAKAAGVPVPHRDATGTQDGTVDVTFSLRVKNYGGTWLYDVQLPDLMEGSGANQFGTYSAAVVPGVGQYTIVAGSVQRVSGGGTAGGTVAAANNAFTGTAAHANLLNAGAVLPPSGEIVVQFVARINLNGRTTTLYNSVKAQAALLAGGPASVFDDSQDGSDPDPDGDGNPGNNAAPTPVATQLPALTIVKSASMPRKVGTGLYDIDYAIKVTNSGSAVAPNVRVIDNLACTFGSQAVPSASITAWQLVGSVSAANNLLVPSSGFTGNVPCDVAKATSTDPSNLPTEIALNMVDGSRALQPGQTETLRFTVRVTESASALGSRVYVTNKAWAAAFDQNTVNPSALLSAASNTVQSLFIDPQGTVYDAVTRLPVAGAVVTLTPQSCSIGASSGITQDQIYGGDSGTYTANANGSISMTTGADGAWQFYFKSPPVTSLCTYVINVTPPAGSGYLYPSSRIPVTAGTYGTCGAIVPNAASPQGNDPTTYYLALVAGLKADGSACDAVHDHIPLDPGSLTGLVLKKEGSKQQVEMGDFLDYALTLTNKTGKDITGIDFMDTLPAGFAYIGGTARLDNGKTVDPQGGRGPNLVWKYPTYVLANGSSAVMHYRVRIGVGATIGKSSINRAVGYGVSSAVSSNTATHTVKVTGGVFSDEAFLFGKVFMDCGKEAIQDGLDEVGVPGVRLFLEDGTNVITDNEGKWSLYGLKPVTHVVRIDETTLPQGTAPHILDNRNAGAANSRFADLKKGEWHKANFPLSGCTDPDAMKRVEARRQAANRPDADGLVALAGARLDPKGATVINKNVLANPLANGQINGTGLNDTQAANVQTAKPLIAMPSAPAQTEPGGSFISTGNAGSGTLGALQGGGFNGVQQLPDGTRSLTAGGIGSGTGTLAAGAPNAQSIALSPAAAKLLPQEVPGVVELERIVPDLDNAPGFIELKDKDTLPGQTFNVRVKGPAESVLQLTVNGSVIDGRRVGKKAELASKKVAAWEYVGVVFKPGVNALRLDVLDNFGNAREKPVEITVSAPDKLGIVHIDLPADIRADGRTPVPITIRLTDAAGVPVTARTQLTLETDGGRWLEEDLNPGEPGWQTFMDGGKAVFHLIPPGQPGLLRLRVSAGVLQQEVKLTLLPDLRPMIAVGVVEGVLDFTKRGKLDVGQMPAGAAFETELSTLGSNNNDGNSRAGGRAAFFLKGAIQGKYLLTAAADTNKSSKDRLFRDIRPDEFYPIYGDSSSRGFDAQSSQRLYVRIDKDSSYLLYGDFTTASSAEVRKLSQTNRTLTGVKNVIQTEQMRITSYGARVSQVSQVEEFQARGVSGPYYLAGTGSLIENSEKVEILVRDRNQPNIILQTTPVSRFIDYTIEPLSKRILFTRPIGSLDANLNPQSIRVTYEIDNDGPKYNVAGTDAQFKLGDNVQIGVVANTDQDPQNKRNLAAVTALARLGDNSSLAAEIVGTHSDALGDGKAGRIEYRLQDENLGIAAQINRTSTGFDNPGAGMAGGHTESSVRGEYRIDKLTQLRAEAYQSKDATSGAEATHGAGLSLQRKLSDSLIGEAGLRYGTSSSNTASLFDYNRQSSYSTALGSNQTGASIGNLGSNANAAGAANGNDLVTVRGRLTAKIPNLPQAQAFVEGEQDLQESSRHMLAVGGNYALTDKTRLYGRYEGVSTLYNYTGTQSRNVGIFGVESNYMEGGRIYNEYRLADAIDGRAAAAALGVRNTFKIDDHWRATAGVERTQGITGAGRGGGTLGQEATAIVGGLEYTADRIRASGILESRHGAESDTVLTSLGMAYKLDPSWSLLTRGVYSGSKGKGVNEGSERNLSRSQLGVAYRPVEQDLWNALARYEYKTESIRGSGAASGVISGNAFGSDATQAGDYAAHIVSTHINYNPTPADQVMGRFAAKRSTYDDLAGSKSSYMAQLLQARVIHDINANWDIGLQAGLMHGSDGSWQKTAGAEIGYQVIKNLWASGGYNFVGLSDRDLTAGEYTSKGAYLRLRFKFDETGLGFSTPTPREREQPALPAKITPPEAGGAQPGNAAAQLGREIQQVDSPAESQATAKPETMIQAAAESKARGAVVIPGPTLEFKASRFEEGSAVLTVQGKAALDALLHRIKKTGDTLYIRLAEAAQTELDQQRAATVRDYLLAAGIPASRIGLGREASETTGHRFTIALAGSAE